MGFIDRRALGLGWQPDVDPATAPAGAFLRADNLTLQEKGVLALRRDAALVYTLPELIVHSLHTEWLSGVKWRLAGAGDGAYANGGALKTGLTGSGDIAFGAHLGQILFARGVDRWKFDGVTVNRWGLQMTGAQPSATAGAPDGRTFVIGTQAGVPAFVATEGGGLAYVPNHNGVVNAATSITPDATTFRATLTATFATPNDFNVYDNQTTGDDSDLVSFYVYLTDPSKVSRLDLLIDVNRGDFQTDYYLGTFFIGQPADVGPTTGGPFAVDVINPVDGSADPTSPVQPADITPGNVVTVPFLVGWNKVQITRGQMQRVGTTSGTDWTTVKAVRVAVQAFDSSAIYIDTVRIAGGRLTGAYEWLYVYVNDNGTYVALSGPSASSDPVPMASSGAHVLIPYDSARDPQAKDVWLFRRGGPLPEFLRVAVQPIGAESGTPAIFSMTQFWESSYLEHLDQPIDNGVANYVVDFEGDSFGDVIDPSTVFGPGVYTNLFELTDGFVAKAGMSPTRQTLTGAMVIEDTLSDVSALIENIPLEADNARPPINIIDIEGPWFDRTWVLTSDGMLWPSRELNPDSFATGQAIRISAEDETAYWVKKGIGGLYVGTSKDIYRLEGDATELPDGSINVAKRSLNVDHPPVSDGITHEGNVLVYVANDGWRAFTGETTQSLVGGTSLLYRGYTRHGVSPINLTTGRFRAGISRGYLVGLAPEAPEQGSTTVLYARTAEGGWERHVYTSRFDVVYAERDGTLLAGDLSGGVWELLTANASAIPVTLWTPADDCGDPFAPKTSADLHLTVDTGGDPLTILALRDGQGAGGVTFAASSTGLNLRVLDVSGMQDFRQLQLQMTGSFRTFRYAGYGLTVVPRPAGVLRWDTGPIDLARGELAWVRRLYVRAQPSGPITATVIIDGAIKALQTVPAGSGVDLQIPIDFGKGVVGRQVRLVLTSANPFLAYSCQIQLRPSGKGSQKPIITVSAA